MKGEASRKAVEEACSHYPASDAGLFREAYGMLERLPLEGRIAIEVCCGRGDLAAWLARVHPGARVHGIDYWEGHILEARKRHGHLRNLSFSSGDALRLDGFRDGSVRLVVGQATLHHLSNNLPGAAREFSRVLEEGGGCVFVFEPLGHNPLVAAIRGALNSRREWIDESALFVGALEQFGSSFSSHRISYHNLLNYAAKILPSRPAFRSVSRLLARLDQRLFARWPALRRHAANCNVYYRK